MASGAAVFMGVSAALSAASGAMSIVQGQQRAEALESRADAARDRAEFTAAVERNKAVARSQDARFQESVAEFNRAQAIEREGRALDRARDKREARLATLRAEAASRNALDGSFSDVLDAETDELFQRETDILAQGSENIFQFGREAELAGTRSRRLDEIAGTRSRLRLSAGENRAASLEGQASSARIGSIGTAAGSFTQAGASGARAARLNERASS